MLGLNLFSHEMKFPKMKFPNMNVLSMTGWIKACFFWLYVNCWGTLIEVPLFCS